MQRGEQLASIKAIRYPRKQVTTFLRSQTLFQQPQGLSRTKARKEFHLRVTVMGTTVFR